jgi:hypothetical protein
MKDHRREEAKELLVWYFDQAVKAARDDHDLSEGAHEEIGAIVDLIVDAALEEIRARLAEL